MPDRAAADEASRNAGEELAWVGKTSGDTIMLFYLGRETWSVFFQRPDGQVVYRADDGRENSQSGHPA